MHRFSTFVILRQYTSIVSTLGLFFMFVFPQRTLTLVNCSMEINNSTNFQSKHLFLIRESFHQIPEYLQIYTTAIIDTPPSPGPQFGIVELCPILAEVLFPTLLLPLLSPLVLVLVEFWELDWGVQGFGKGSLFSVWGGWLSPPDDSLLTKEANGLPPNYRRRNKHTSSISELFLSLLESSSNLSKITHEDKCWWLLINYNHHPKRSHCKYSEKIPTLKEILPPTRKKNVNHTSF